MATAADLRPRTADEALDTELETILTSFDTNYVWNYGSVKEGLRDLYEKAKREQWNGTEQLDWTVQVDPEAEIIPAAFNPLADYGPYKALDKKGVARMNHAQIAWQLSQFMHGEQGALIVASQLVGAVPWMDAKYYAATQTMDEARHVEVFSRYLRDKLEWEWPINPNLKKLLDPILLDCALGHEVPRHADPGRGPRDGRLRQPLPAREGAARQAAHPLRDEGRVPPRGLRRDVAARLLRGHVARASARTARSS